MRRVEEHLLRQKEFGRAAKVRDHDLVMGIVGRLFSMSTAYYQYYSILQKRGHAPPDSQPHQTLEHGSQPHQTLEHGSQVHQTLEHGSQPHQTLEHGVGLFPLTGLGGIL